jgi:hydrogenase-4 component E
MINFLIILFIVSLIYLAKVEMVKSYFSLMAVQGVLLFGLAYFELKELDIIHLIFILLETLVFKAIFVPLYLQRITKNRIHRHHHAPIKGYYAVLIASFIIIGCFFISYKIHDELTVNADEQVKYFTAAISSIMVGLFIAINNRDLVTHLISYLVIENGIFLLSLGLGGEMPMFVNSAILLDIFTSVLIMGMFFNKMKDYFQNLEASELSQLKD